MKSIRSTISSLSSDAGSYFPHRYISGVLSCLICGGLFLTVHWQGNIFFVVINAAGEGMWL
jgi:hypothetical protein